MPSFGGIQGITGIVRHGAAATTLADDAAEAVEVASRIARTRNAPLNDALRGSASWTKGTALELAAERWLHRNGFDVTRNVSTDLVLPGGDTIRPDFFAPDALDGALFLGESKALDHVALRAQLATYADIARANDVPLHLFVPQRTTFSGPMQALVDEGVVKPVFLRMPRAAT